MLHEKIREQRIQTSTNTFNPFWDASFLTHFSLTILYYSFQSLLGCFIRNKTRGSCPSMVLSIPFGMLQLKWRDWRRDSTKNLSIPFGMLPVGKIRTEGLHVSLFQSLLGCFGNVGYHSPLRLVTFNPFWDASLEMDIYDTDNYSLTFNPFWDASIVLS